MSYYLFLDDSRQPHKVDWANLPENVSWVVAKTYEEFVNVVTNMGIPKFITYDCDLCDEHYQAYFELKQMYPAHYKRFQTKCGIDCAEFLLERCQANNVKHPEYIIHSKNQYGGAYIRNLIEKSLDPQAKLVDIELMPASKLPPYVEHSEKMISGFFGDYRFLSNFWPAKVEFMGLVFPSTECAYQAAKCADKNQMLQFTTAHSAEAKKLGRNVALRGDWTEENRIAIMNYLVFQKFSRSVHLREMLLHTGEAQLVEANSWRDNFWGINYEETQPNIWSSSLYGKNNLGKILISVRSALR